MHKRKNLVFLPGWGSHSDDLWHAKLSQLARLFNILTLVVTDQPTVCGMACEVLRQAPDTFILLGHSLGGLVAQQVANDAPHRVERLILVSTFSGQLPKLQRTFFERHLLKPKLSAKLAEHRLHFNKAFLAPEQASNTKLLRTLAAAQKLSSQELINQTQALIGARNVSQRPEGIDIPTLVIYGRQDQLFTLPMQDRLIAKLTPCTVAALRIAGICRPLNSLNC